eukprot:scaffold30617_cov79-Isochrysis_galbana.AAC.1
MKLETTRPSYGCMPGPYVLKMRATRMSTPARQRGRGKGRKSRLRQPRAGKDRKLKAQHALLIARRRLWAG